MKIKYRISVVLIYMLFSFSMLFSQNTNFDFENVFINTHLSNTSIVPKFGKRGDKTHTFKVPCSNNKVWNNTGTDFKIKVSISSYKDIVKISDNINKIQLELLGDMSESAKLIYSLLETLLPWATNQKEKIEISVMKHNTAHLIKLVSNNLRHIRKSKNTNLNSNNIEDGCFTKYSYQKSHNKYFKIY